MSDSGNKHLGHSKPPRRVHQAVALVRIAYSAVFIGNVMCALEFIIQPDCYAGAYELSGVAGMVAVQGMGVVFLMWNATYPVAIASPLRFRPVVGIVVVQQIIGLIGELWIYATLPAGHKVLAGSIMRFIVFDAGGLVLMAAAWGLLSLAIRRYGLATAQN